MRGHRDIHLRLRAGGEFLSGGGEPETGQGILDEAGDPDIIKQDGLRARSGLSELQEDAGCRGRELGRAHRVGIAAADRGDCGFADGCARGADAQRRRVAGAGIDGHGNRVDLAGHESSDGLGDGGVLVEQPCHVVLLGGHAVVGDGACGTAVHAGGAGDGPSGDGRADGVAAGFETGIHDDRIAEVPLHDGDGIIADRGVAVGGGHEGQRAARRGGLERHIAELVGGAAGGRGDTRDVVQRGPVPPHAEVHRAAAAGAGVVEELDPVAPPRGESADDLAHGAAALLEGDACIVRDGSARIVERAGALVHAAAARPVADGAVAGEGRVVVQLEARIGDERGALRAQAKGGGQQEGSGQAADHALAFSGTAELRSRSADASAEVRGKCFDAAARHPVYLPA